MKLLKVANDVSRRFVVSNLGGSRNKVTLNMTYTEEYIRNKLTSALEASHVEVLDESGGCGAKFSCVVVSDKFQGKNALQRHRMQFCPETKEIMLHNQEVRTRHPFEYLKNSDLIFLLYRAGEGKAFNFHWLNKFYLSVCDEDCTCIDYYFRIGVREVQTLQDMINFGELLDGPYNTRINRVESDEGICMVTEHPEYLDPEDD